MTLKEYKKKIEEILVEKIGIKTTKTLMKDYENDFAQKLKDGWNVEEMASFMMLGF